MLRRNLTQDQSRTDEGGFTLVELLISTVIVGIIGAAIASALIVVLQSQNDMSDRLGTARMGDSLAIWFPSDVASASDAAAPGTWQCSGAAPGTNVLTLTQQGIWTSGAAATTKIVSYQIISAGAPAVRSLVRYTCDLNGPASQILIAGRLAPSPAGATGAVVKPAAIVQKVTFTVDAAGDNGLVSSVTVSASPRKAA